MRRLPLLLALLSTPAFAAVPTVTITGKVLAPSGGSYGSGGTIACTITPVPGSATDTGTGAQQRIGAGPYTLTIGSDGTVSGTLVPNDVITPAGTGYTCLHTLATTRRTSWSEYWSLTSSPATIDVGAINRPTVTALTLPTITGAAGTLQASNGSGGLADAGVTMKSVAKPDSSPAMPCLDIWGPDNSRDGTCDLWFDPTRGFVRANGEPHFSGRVTIFGLVSDQHGGKDCGDCDGVLEAGDSAASWMAVEARTYGISQTFALQAKDDCWGYAVGSCPYHCETADWNGDGTSECGYGWGSQEVQTYRAAGMQVGTHVGSHCTIGPMSPTLSEGWRDNAAGGAYKDTNATFSVTEGSATVTGTNSEFSAECGDPTYNFNPPGSLLLVDVDGKGTAAGTVVERYIARVDSATVLTLDAALPSDLDADGTTGETFSALPAWYDDDDADSTVNYDDNTGTGHVGIITSPRQWRADVKDSCDRIRTQTGDSDWICRTGASVGPAEINDGWEVLLATYGLQTWSNEAGAASYHQRGGASPVGAPTALAAGRFIIDCANDWTTGMLPAFEAAVRARGALVMLSGHTAYAVGACTAANDDYWRQDTYTSFLQWCRDRMRDGTAICTDVDTAMRLHRVYNEEASFGANLLVNPEVRRFSGLAQPSAADADQPTDRWPWFSPDAAADFDGTAYMQDYDGTNEWTEWRDHSGTVTMQQGVRLQGGAYYAIHGWFKTTGYARGAAQGVRMCMEPVLARETGGAPEVIAFPTIWTTFPVVDANDGEVSTQAIANAINCSGYVNGEGKERSIFGFFYVPPELEGQWVRIGPKFIGSTGGAKVYMRDLSIVRYLPHPYNRAKFGSYTVPWATTSHFPHQGYSASAQNYAPWQWWWIPHVDGRSNAPNSDTWKVNTVNASGTKVALFALSGSGRVESKSGVLVGDPDADGSSLCITRKADCNGTTECVLFDLDCDGTVDAEDFCLHTDAIDVDC